MRTLADLLAPLAEVDEAGLYFGDDFVSWRDHLHRSRIRAAALAAVLGEPRPHVGVLLPNVPEFSYLFGAAALGGPILAGLNSTRRGEALTADIRTADCRAVIVDVQTEKLLDGLEVGVPVFRTGSATWRDLLARQATATPPPPPPRPSDLMMLIFTSGTTGTPKAVRCEQRKFAEPAVMLAERFGLGTADVAYLAMPMFHSNALIAGWSVAVAAGGSVALRERFSANGFGDDIRRYRVTYANYVGKPLRYILATDPRPDDAETPLRIMYGNEATAADRRAFAQRFGCRVIDGFGSTEGGVSVTRTPETPDDALGPLIPPVAVVDPDTDEPVPPGEIGEIVNTAGAGLFSGYYGDEAATAERLRGGRYRSGDLGWVDEEGYLHFAGRIGDWLRVDGENLGTRPIEQILLRHPQVTDALVFGVPAEIGDEVGAVLVADGLDQARLADFLSDQSDLGPKQWPSRIWLVDELPDTATFKTARAALRERLGEPSWRLYRPEPGRSRPARPAGRPRPHAGR